MKNVAAFVLLGFCAGVPAWGGGLASTEVCVSPDKIAFTVRNQKTLRVCGTIPLHVSLWNRSEDRTTVLQKVVIRSGSRGVVREMYVGKALTRAGDELDRFCTECTGDVRCGDAEPCGNLYAALESSGYEADADVSLAAGKGCVGEQLDLEAYLAVADEQVVLRRTLVIEDATVPATGLSLAEIQLGPEGDDLGAASPLSP